MAPEALAQLFRSDGDEQHVQNLRRKAMYLPPAPVTPFRGGLKSVPNSEQDDDDNINVDSSEDSSLEASSSDRHGREPGVGFSTKSSSHVSSSNGASSWAPEDYPDPWTNPILCGGAATSHLLNEEYQGQQPYSLTDLGLGRTSQQSASQIRRPLFCDPDQVLDKSTLSSVAVQLRAFAENFASLDVMEGGDFGSNSSDEHLANEGGEVDIRNQEDSSHSSPPQESVPADNGDVVTRRLSTYHGDIFPQSSHDLRGTVLSEKRLYSDSAGGIFSATNHREAASKKESVKDHQIEVAIALVKRINLPAILRADSYFFYSDQDDMVNDAAQYFARYIHDTWAKLLAQEQKAANGADSSPPATIVLIFISTLDRICYISSGTRVTSILPWWRLEHVVQDMKIDLRKGETGHALSLAIDDLTALLLEGPPSFSDRVNDFFQRFGIILLFTIFTFVFATWGECRDRRKRIFFAERRSRMTAAEREKAMALQRGFGTKMCPICLEPFDSTPDNDSDTETNSLNKEDSPKKQTSKVRRVDNLDVPLVGSDGKPIKILRCGHIFDMTCWQMWIDSGQGNPWICPVCRQDVGRTKRRQTTQGGNSGEDGDGGDASEGDIGENHEQSSLLARMMANATGPSMLLRPVNPSQHTNYNSLQPRAQRGNSTFAPISHPTLRRLHPLLGLSAASSMHPIGIGEQTPLFARASTSNDEDDDC